MCQKTSRHLGHFEYLTDTPKVGRNTYNLTHWGRVTHICVSKLTSIGSDNGLSPGRRQAIIWTNVGILLIRPLGTNFSEILIEIYTFSFKKMHLKISSGKWRPYCLGLNVLKCHSEDCACWCPDSVSCWDLWCRIRLFDGLIQKRHYSSVSSALGHQFHKKKETFRWLSARL